MTPEYEKNKDQKYYASIDFDKRFYLVIFSAQPKEGDAKNKCEGAIDYNEINNFSRNGSKISITFVNHRVITLTASEEDVAKDFHVKLKNDLKMSHDNEHEHEIVEDPAPTKEVDDPVVDDLVGDDPIGAADIGDQGSSTPTTDETDDTVTDNTSAEEKTEQTKKPEQQNDPAPIESEESTAVGPASNVVTHSTKEVSKDVVTAPESNGADDTSDTPKASGDPEPERETKKKASPRGCFGCFG